MDGEGEAMPVVLHAWSGGPTTAGTATVGSSATGARVLNALRTVGLGLIVAVVLLPVPVIHLAGIGIFVACLGIAVWQVRPGLRVRTVEGPCPHCGQEHPWRPSDARLLDVVPPSLWVENAERSSKVATT